MTPSLLGLGDNTIDSYVDLSRQFPGGNAVNVAVLAACHGARAAYLGCIGNDDAGDAAGAGNFADLSPFAGFTGWGEKPGCDSMTIASA